MRNITLIVSLIYTLFSYGQIDKSQMTIVTITKGPFYITTNKDSLEVYFNIDRLKYSMESRVNWKECDVSFSITDKNRREIYRRNFPSYNGDGSNIISVEQLVLPDIGMTLLVNYESVPSSGGAGYDGQVFGINSLGYFVPITGIIHMDNGSLTSVENLNPLWAKLQQDIGVVRLGKCENCEPYIKVITHTGFCGLSIVEYYYIRKEGIFLENTDATFPFFKKQIEVSNEILLRFKQTESTAIRDTFMFYSSPNKFETKPRNKVVKGNSIVGFIDLTINDSGFWLRMRIDGYEGYVHLDEEYQKFGFQPCE